MIRFAVIFIATAFLLSSCGVEKLKEENEKLKAQIDSTQQANNIFNQQLTDIGVLLDSIETSEDVITMNLERGTSYTDHVERLRILGDYITDTENQLKEMENAIGSLDTSNGLYKRMIKDLRDELTKKQKLIDGLNSQLEEFKTENAALIKTVEMQNDEIAAKEVQIQMNKEAIDKLQDQINTISTQKQEQLADSYFLQAEQETALAEKTKFAPKKKKEHYEKAYGLYQQAFENGKQDAYEKMKELEGKF